MNHPNIAGIHGLEQEGSTHAIAMELVEGDTLAARISKGAIPLEEALQIALQIATALEAAHEKGIIHRDLKPANVIVTPERTVKVLDFGLAKAMEPESTSDGDLSQSPTLTMQATQARIILGTAAYMSPEQARGYPVDRRTDIWAFGCLLYETLTAQSPFQEETIADVLAAVVNSEPDWKMLPEDAPWMIRNLQRRCLKKDRSQRLQHIGDARLEIEDVLAGASPEIPSTIAESAAQSSWRRVIPGTLLGLAIGATLTGVLVWNLKPGSAPESGSPTRLSLVLPPQMSLTSLGQSCPCPLAQW